jgi:hypothetical protein
MLQIFNFKGLYQAGKKMAVPLGYFRRFTNAYKDRAGRIVPYGRGDTGATDNEPNVTVADTDFYGPLFSSVFQGKIFQLMRGLNSGGDNLGAFKFDEDDIVQPYVDTTTYTQNTIPIDDFMLTQPADSYTSAVVNNKLFVCEYVEDIVNSGSLHYTLSNIFKFDGLRVTRAGLPIPYASVIPDNTTGDRRLRTVYFSIGLDGEPVFSDYLEVQFKASTTTSLYTASNKTNTGTDVEDPVANGWTFYIFASKAYHPTSRPDNDYLGDPTFRGATADETRPAYYDLKFVLPTIAGAPDYPNYDITKGVVFPKVASGYYNLKVGDWVMHVTQPISTMRYGAMMFKCTSITLTGGSNYEIVFDHVIKVFDASLNWSDIDLRNGEPAGLGISSTAYGLANIWAAHYVSGNGAGTLPYYFWGAHIVTWGANIHITTSNTWVGLASTLYVSPEFKNVLGVMTYDWDDWYDTNDVKVIFPPVVGITAYAGLLVGFDRNALYFSASSLGGSTEMTSGNSNLVPTGEEYGELVAACGTEDFLFVSRERRNYIIRGELTTGNVTVVECDVAVSGAINARAVSNSFSGKVVFVNQSGIFACDGSGTIQEISKDIRDLFLDKSEDGNLFDSDNLKTRQEIVNDFSNFDGTFIKIALEEHRGFIIVMTGRKTAGGDITNSNMLVYDTNDGSWYEFGSSGATSVETINGKIIQLGQSRTEEDGVLYSTEQLVATNWVTLDKPSLEKQITQLKLYGKLRDGADTTVKLGQQNNFQKLDGTSTDDYETYASFNAPSSSEQYVHKKRLDSSKAQSTSILIRQTAETSNGAGFEIEGLELEISDIQEGVKK